MSDEESYVPDRTPAADIEQFDTEKVAEVNVPQEVAVHRDKAELYALTISGETVIWLTASQIADLFEEVIE